jgi:surfeit locus 1 family protein
MEYRKVNVGGTYNHNKQIALRNQYWGNQWGVHLITPLQISGSDQIILVDRGWIPAEDFQSGDWSQFDEPGEVTVAGILRRSQDKADFGSRSDPQVQAGDEPRTAWNFVNIERLTVLMSSTLLPAYIQQAPEPSWKSLPYRYQPTLDLTEGPHFGYALQWFTFATILGLGYPFFIQRQERRHLEKAGEQPKIGQPTPVLHSNKR